MRGKSGEWGCLQYLPSTWRLFSTEVYGEIKEQNAVREKYVAYKMIEKWLDQGLTVYQIALKWNQGSAGPCRKGVNAHGVEYDSCSYANQVVAYVNRP